MNIRQANTLDFVRAAAAHGGWNFRVSSTDYVHMFKDGKTIIFTISPRGDFTHLRMDSQWGLDYTRKQAQETLDHLLDVYSSAAVHDPVSTSDDQEDFSDVEQHLDQNQPEPKIEYQVWWHLNMELMDENVRKKFLDENGNVPQFLAVSHLYTYGDAQKVMNDYQRRFPGNFYYVKEVAA